MSTGSLGRIAGVVIIVSIAALARSSSRPFISSISPDATITNYDVFTPTINSADAEMGTMTVTVESDTYSFELLLELNKNLLSPDFSSISYDSNGQEVIVKGHQNCFYQGKVSGHPTWTAAVSTCDGLRGSFGNISKKKQLFYIEPLAGQDANPLAQPHAIYGATENPDKVGTCGVPHGEGLHVGAGHNTMSLQDTISAQAENGFLVVELAVVNDMAQIAKFGGVRRAVKRALDIINTVDSVYKPLGIRVVLAKVISWNNGDQITIDTDSSKLLENFLAFYPQITSPRDTAMLFTAIELDDAVGGRAFVETMCSPFAVGLVQDTGSLTETATATAHEMGHIFSMEHDSATCTCNDANGCIMGGGRSKWSDCSIKSLNSGLNNNLGFCLTNDPTSTVGAPVCGNGILEGNEACDCGTPKECKNPCCDATTCKLASGAQCSSGACCNSCKFKAYGTVCRPSAGECGITEFCTGTSALCPLDLNKMNGSPCAAGQGFCFNGSCPTRDSQCKTFYGVNSGDGAAGCYRTFNPRGDLQGNCGITGIAGSLIPCAAGDVLCGSLQCLTTGSKFPTVNLDFEGSIHIGINDISSTQKCKSFFVKSSTDSPTNNIWLPAAGTKCGTNQVCLSGKCTLLPSPTCRRGANGIVCSGNGQCSDAGTCACNLGFTGSRCSTPFAE